MKKKPPAQSAGPQIPPWRQRADGTVESVRDASFWRAAGGGAVECVLCYRNCTLEPGQDGWCGYRGNRGGRMVLHAHGQLGALWRWLLAYDVGSPAYKPGALALGIGQLHCTAACSFCYVSSFSTHPERMPWLANRRGALAATGGHYGARAMLHPLGAVGQAQRVGAVELALSYNEPLLSWEWTYDVCRLAHKAGLGVTIFTNGFSTESPILKLAPFVSHVKFGIKGSGCADFYAKHMRSAGAMDAVRASIEAWRSTGARVSLSDVIPAEHLQTDQAADEAQRRFYSWAAERCGPHVVMHIGELHRFADNVINWSPLLSVKADVGAANRYRARVARAVEQARAAGLHYVHGDDAGVTLTCHRCGGTLVRTFAPRTEGDLRIYPRHEQHATAGRCDHCGTTVPIVTLAPDQLEQARQRWNADPQIGEVVRVR